MDQGTPLRVFLDAYCGAASRALWNVADFPVKTLIDYVERLDVIKLISQIFVDEVLDNDGELDFFICTLAPLTFMVHRADVVWYPRCSHALHDVCCYEL